MIKRVCDCCGEEMKKYFINFRINYAKSDVVSGETDGTPRNTLYLEYCEKCFCDVLEKLGLDKE